MRQPANADVLQAKASSQTSTAPAASRVHTLLTFAIVLAALLLRWPGLQAGLHSDDYVQDAMLSGVFPAQRSALTLYDFGGRERTERASLRAQGWFPWWSAEDLRLAMFRPLSSALIAADRVLAPRNPALRHAHSAAWCVALLLGVAAVLRRALPARTALLALGLFAAEPALSVPLAWLANRNALVATAFGVWALYAYLRFRDEPRARWPAGAALGFALSALAGEYGLPLLSYVIAYEVLLVRDAPARRVRCAAVALVPALVVVGTGAALGYGSRGSGLYISPLLEPLRYAAAIPARVPVLAAELLCALPAAPNTETAALGATCAAVLAMAVLGAGMRLAAPPLRSRLRWLGASCLLGLPLLAGALPESRLLLPVALGSSAVIAAVLALLFDRARGAHASGVGARLVAGSLALALLVLHLGVKPVRALRAAELLAGRARNHTAWALRAQVDDAGAPAQDWIVIAARDFTTAQILPYARAFHGHGLPRSYRVLSLASGAHVLSRPDTRTLELRVLGEPTRDAFAGSLHRARTDAFVPGATLAAGDLRVRVEQVAAGQPVRMRFQFPHAVDDGSYVFLHPGAAGLTRIALPAIGAHVQLPPPRAPRLPR